MIRYTKYSGREIQVGGIEEFKDNFTGIAAHPKKGYLKLAAAMARKNADRYANKYPIAPNISYALHFSIRRRFNRTSDQLPSVWWDQRYRSNGCDSPYESPNPKSVLSSKSLKRETYQVKIKGKSKYPPKKGIDPR